MVSSCESKDALSMYVNKGSFMNNWVKKKKTRKIEWEEEKKQQREAAAAEARMFFQSRAKDDFKSCFRLRQHPKYGLKK